MVHAQIAAVDESYRHVSKRVTSGALLNLGSSRLKWYDIARAETPVEPAIRARAKEFLEGEAKSGRLGFDREIGFVELHRCGSAFYCLITCSWRHSNELWKTIYYKDGPSMQNFVPWKALDQHHPGFCVWELGPIIHEQKEWIRFLRSARDEAALRAYLESEFEGDV